MAQSDLILRPPSTQSDLILRPLPVEEGGTVEAYLPTFALAPASDAGDVINGNASSATAGRIDFTMQNPAVVSRLPSAQGVWESTSLIDLKGDEINDADDLDLDDMVQLWVRGDQATLAVDRVLSVGMNLGVVNAVNVGWAAQIEYTATGNRVQHAFNAGAGWAITNATAISALTVWGIAKITVGTASTQGRLSAHGADAVKELVPTSNTMTAPASANVGATFDRVFVGAGYATGVGGAAGAQSIGANVLMLRPREIVYDPFS